ncbi:neurogenic locus notch homolog protein 1-like [Mercenaria mercenaria]|uniref:neurogenic locus notch homolog protein 1-like n=1 Tax=Mercenaria mercenaria TaxID=6596 RepID=UPI00234F3A46|nr:neurogenic locus notch homolog protein 1-like [Mercenaria mercenaria]
MISEHYVLSFLILTVNIVDIHTGAICLDICVLIPDPCDGKTCEPKETCSLEWNCICSATSTSPDCVNVTTTTQYVTEKNKPSPCPCIHGHCTTQFGRVCKCDNGWTGSHCELKDSSIHTSYNVCDSTYKQRPRSERECYNWKCIHGICIVKGSQVFCECDPGATGQICQNKCCRQCVFGECFYVKEEEREICVCHADNSGTYCENKDLPTINKPIDDDVKWHFWVAGTCAVLLLILITLMIVVPCIIWRNLATLVTKALHSIQR